jgi:hypothetical protein
MDSGRATNCTYTTTHKGLTGLDVSSKLASIADGIGVLVLAHICKMCLMCEGSDLK